MINGEKLNALRVTFMGELGWELHYENASGGKIADAVLEAGKKYGMSWAGSGSCI